MAEGKYVCAFRGRRDGYQVPLALAEAHRLADFVTDAYATRGVRMLAETLPAEWRERVISRHEPGIPDNRVRSLWFTLVVEQMHRKIGVSPAVTWGQLDPIISRNAAERAAATQSDLFLYTPYAWEAFTTRYRHTPRRVLFEYHPHPWSERALLDEDLQKFPFVARSFRERTGIEVPEAQRKRIEQAWQHADAVVCASSFTKRTLVDAGLDPAICTVVPYGIDVPELSDAARVDGPFRALFVGSGLQRKGLHHLLLAWRSSRLPVGSSLTLVCRNYDPGLQELISSTPGIRLLRRRSQGELATEYQSADLFVMPSLVEGFGQVYLEALSHGCPILGTPNTCLPDLGHEADGVFLSEPGIVESLIGKLERLSTELPEQYGSIRQAARATARRFSWSRFRDSIKSLL